MLIQWRNQSWNTIVVLAYSLCFKTSTEMKHDVTHQPLLNSVNGQKIFPYTKSKYIMPLLLIGSSSSLWNHAKKKKKQNKTGFPFPYDGPSATWRLLLYFLCFPPWAKYLQSTQLFLLIPFPYTLLFLSLTLDMFQFIIVSLQI